jgi:hypothetical protein
MVTQIESNHALLLTKEVTIGLYETQVAVEQKDATIVSECRASEGSLSTQ